MGVVYLIFYTLAIFHLLHFYPMLPGMIPTRFNADGVAVAQLTRERFALLHLCFVLFMSGSFGVIAVFVKRLPPRFINIPNKDYWLAKERRAETMHGLYTDICWMGIATGGFVIALDHQLIDAALRNAHGITPETLSTLVTSLAVLMGLIVGRMLLKFRKPAGAK